MKSFIVLALFVAVAVAVPLSDSKNAQIVRYVNDNIGVEGYKFAVETDDGKSAQEEGVLTDVGTETEGIAVRGQFSYVAPDGLTYTVTYVADKNGFQPQGAHLPVGPQ